MNLLRFVRLGVQIAVAPGSRRRTLLGAAVTLLGTVLLLLVAAIARGEVQTSHPNIGPAELKRLVLVVASAVALPLAVLIATVARLSASVRDRRLAGLRLIGLTPGQTRLVAAAEAWTSSAAGTALGILAFLALLPFLSATQRPALIDVVAVAVGILGLTGALAVLPHRGSAASALERARRADRRPPSLLRVIPLALGTVALCALVAQHDNSSPSNATLGLLLGGVLLTGVGVITVLPVFVRLLAAGLGRWTRSPAASIAAGRLVAQPARVSRVVAALLIGLFLGTSARYVVGAFEATSTYRDSQQQIERGQVVAARTQMRSVDKVLSTATAIDGVNAATAFPSFDLRDADCQGCATALVATCADLSFVAPEIRGCREGEPMWLDSDSADRLAGTPSLVWLSGSRPHRTTVLTMPNPAGVFPQTASGGYPSEALGPLHGDVLIPPSLVPDLPPNTRVDVVMRGEPGRDLPWKAESNGLRLTTYSDFEFYDYVRKLRALALGLTAFILAVGLLAFAAAAIDRAVERRRELTGLRLLGLPSRVLRTSQWLEAALPITVGSTLAVGLGTLAGATYLSFADGELVMPWSASGGIALAALVGSVLIAGLTVVASVQPIRPEMVRRE